MYVRPRLRVRPRNGGIAAFTPLSLFSGGAKGAWYDPSDYSTLFQDSAGTTPVTAVEQPVGLMLDKSQGLVLGSELNDGLDVLANWTVFGTNTIAQDGDAIKVTYVSNALGAYSLFQAAKGLSTNLTVGQWYKVTGQAKVNTGSANVTINTASVWTSSAITSTTYVDFTIYFLCDNATTNYIAFSNLQTGEEIWIRGVSVKSLAGNHASQSTAASRPVLRARYNLLTYSEQFDNAAWSKISGTSITANATTAPNGTTTADLMYPTTTGASRSVYQTINAGNIVSVYAKANGINHVWIIDKSGGAVAAWFNLSTGAVGTIVAGYTSSIESVGDGWYRCVLRANTGNFVYAQIGLSDADNSLTSTTNGTSGIYIWGAQLVYGSSAGTYQRIAAATDYATAGFLPYLAFDGTDDSMATGSIDFSATNAMSVCVGVSKLSDAAQGTIVELSASTDTNANAFNIRAPNASLNNYQFEQRGTAFSVATVTQTAPDTAVITGINGQVSPFTSVRRNNGAFGINTTNPNISAFGNYPLYIGRRGGTSLPFNGRIYQMVVCGKALSASELASTEAFVNTKTGAY